MTLQILLPVLEVSLKITGIYALVVVDVIRIMFVVRKVRQEVIVPPYVESCHSPLASLT